MSGKNQTVTEKRNLKDSAKNLRLPTHQPTQPPPEWIGELTRGQALAVSWTGLGALAINGQLTIFNDHGTGILWIGIANAKFDKDSGEIVDLEIANTSANAAPVANTERGAP